MGKETERETSSLTTSNGFEQLEQKKSVRKSLIPSSS